MGTYMFTKSSRHKKLAGYLSSWYNKRKGAFIIASGGFNARARFSSRAWKRTCANYTMYAAKQACGYGIINAESLARQAFEWSPILCFSQPRH